MKSSENLEMPRIPVGIIKGQFLASQQKTKHFDNCKQKLKKNSFNNFHRKSYFTWFCKLVPDILWKISDIKFFYLSSNWSWPGNFTFPFELLHNDPSFWKIKKHCFKVVSANGKTTIDWIWKPFNLNFWSKPNTSNGSNIKLLNSKCFYNSVVLNLHSGFYEGFNKV